MPNESYDPQLSKAGFMDLVCAIQERLNNPDARETLEAMSAPQRKAAVRIGATAKTYLDIVEGCANGPTDHSEMFNRLELYELNDALHEVVTRMCDRGQTDSEVREQSLAHLWSALKKVTILLLGDSNTPGIRNFEPTIIEAIANPRILKNKL